MFITLDGIDGAGKSTQIAMLCDWLSTAGHDLVSVRDPGSTAAGEAIRGLLLNSQLEMHRRSEALLYMAARSQLVEERIRPALAAGAVVVSDRFLLANVVYQSVGDGSSSPSGPSTREHRDQLWHLGDIATGGLRPDLTVLLDLPARQAYDRLTGPADRMESRGVDYLENVREAFRAELPRSSRDTVIVDATQAVQHMHQAIVEAVAATISAEAISRPPAASRSTKG